MAERVAALIPAAGEGARLGRGPKAFIDLGGKTLLERAAAAFTGRVDEVIVAVAAERVRRAEALLGDQARVIAGGAERQASVYRLLQATGAELVLVHDAARPFLGARVTQAVLEAVRRTGAASAATPVADTLIEAESGAGVERSGLRAMQTPQGFRRLLLLEAHERALEDGWQTTDDAGLVRKLGHAVALVAGSAWLMKVTTPADLEVASALAGAWDAGVWDAGVRDTEAVRDP
jgi:2-C-methyl-D-erythritol 4-phosphate cytidylyltransferase